MLLPKLCKFLKPPFSLIQNSFKIFKFTVEFSHAFVYNLVKKMLPLIDGAGYKLFNTKMFSLTDGASNKLFGMKMLPHLLFGGEAFY